MQRRDFIRATGAAMLAASMPDGFASEAETHRPWNLLLITVDDMNYSIPGFMGGKNNLTPSLDALAARSYRFVNNRTTAAICQPSREAMMTGRVPHHSGGLGFNPIHTGVPTLTSVLKEHGYHTAVIHKTEHMQPPSCFPWDFQHPGESRRPSEYGDAVKEAIDEARALKKPFFINCNINDPHRPFYGSPQAAKIDQNEEGEYKIAKEIHPEDVDVPAFLDDLPDVRKELAQYSNSAQRMDISIGKVLDALVASPEADTTMIFFSADHGMPFPFSKATVYDSGTRTPALLCWPGMGKPRTLQSRTCNIDVLPTLLELLSVPAPDGIDGQSWVPIIQHGRENGREFLVTHINSVNSGSEYPARAIQDDRYSLMFCPWSDGELYFRIESMQGLTFEAMQRASKRDPRIEARVKQFVYGFPLAFYDLKMDPGQRRNLIDLPEHRARVATMKKALLAYMETTQDPQLENFRLLLAGKKPVVTQPTKAM